jgi:hypothetical protein
MLYDQAAHIGLRIYSTCICLCFYRKAPAIPEVYERKAHFVPNLQDGARTGVQCSMPDCGISSTTSTTEQLGRVDIVVMDEIDWNGQ